MWVFDGAIKECLRLAITDNRSDNPLITNDRVASYIDTELLLNVLLPQHSK